MHSNHVRNNTVKTCIEIFFRTNHVLFKVGGIYEKLGQTIVGYCNSYYPFKARLLSRLLEIPHVKMSRLHRTRGKYKCCYGFLSLF